MEVVKEKIMECRYQYIKLPREEKRFFCIQQNPLVLAWLLFFKKNTLRPMTIQNGLKKWSRQWLNNMLRNYYSSSRANLRKIKHFIGRKYHLRNITPWVELPFYGQICFLVNKGYKIFDLRRKVAIKVYRTDVDISTITNEVGRLKHGSLFTFGLPLKRINISERWYEESYISGSLDNSAEPRNSQDLLRKFYNEIAPCLESMILHQSPLKINTSDYINEIRNNLKTGNLLKEGIDVNHLDKIFGFIHTMEERLQSNGNIPVFLVLSHGDFCPANMLNTRHGLRIVDWESATPRSALFDFYSYFYFRSVHQKLPLDTLNSEINTALPYVISKFESIAPEISKSLKSSGKIYRWLYYIERISMLIERKRHDTKHNILDIILMFINVFDHYEEISA